MPSKLSIHIRDYPDGIFDAVGRMQPGIIKVFEHDSEMNIDALRRAAKPLVIYRHFTENNDFQAHSAADFVAELERRGTLGKLKGRGILWEGINEPGIGEEGNAADRARARALNDWYIEFAQLMHARGERVAGFSWSTGNPTDRHLGWIIPLISQAAQAVDAHAFHEYTKPRSPTPRSDWGRYRLFERALPPEARKPVVITEAGIDDIGDAHTSGWIAQGLTARAYVDLLAGYDALLGEDSYVLGATVYTLKDPGWPSFEIDGEALSTLADHVSSQGGGMVLGDTWPALKLTVPGVMELAAFPEVPPTITIRVVDQDGAPVPGAAVRLVGDAATLGGDPRAVANRRGLVTWTRRVSGYAGSLWNAWQRYVARDVAGITWEEFRLEAPQYNPSLTGDVEQLQAGTTYYLPENRVHADTRGSLPAVVWDRELNGFSGSLWHCWQQHVQGKVVGLRWTQFKTAMLAHNPGLAGSQGRLQAGGTYVLPRNDGPEEYVRVAFSQYDGRAVFAELQPGMYRVEVAAANYQPVQQMVVLDGVTTPTITLAPSSTLLNQLAGGLGVLGSDFVSTAGQHFALNGRKFRFIGVNLRGLAHYGLSDPVRGASAADQLQAARDMGARVVRIFLPHFQVSVEETRSRLIGLLKLLEERFSDMYLIVALANLYGDVEFRIPGDKQDNGGGFYTHRPIGDNKDLLSVDWFREGYKVNYLPFVRTIVQDEFIRNSPRIMAYNIGNELKAESRGEAFNIGHPDLLVDFMHTMARQLRQLDGGRHLITTGMISTRHVHMAGNTALRLRLYGIPELDFITNHSYHGDDRPETNLDQENEAPSPEDDGDLVGPLGKPLLIEEAGFKPTENRRDRSDWVARELQLLLEQKQAGGYMPWGFMKGFNNGDGDEELGLDDAFHGHDWQPLNSLLNARARTLADDAAEIKPPSGEFTAGQVVFTRNATNLRREPGLNAAIELELPDRTRVTVTGPARPRDGLAWWPVRATLAAGPKDGWIAHPAPSGAAKLSPN